MLLDLCNDSIKFSCVSQTGDAHVIVKFWVVVVDGFDTWFLSHGMIRNWGGQSVQVHDSVWCFHIELRIHFILILAMGRHQAAKVFRALSLVEATSLFRLHIVEAGVVSGGCILSVSSKFVAIVDRLQSWIDFGVILCPYNWLNISLSWVTNLLWFTVFGAEESLFVFNDVRSEQLSMWFRVLYNLRFCSCLIECLNLWLVLLSKNISYFRSIWWKQFISCSFKALDRFDIFIISPDMVKVRSLNSGVSSLGSVGVEVLFESVKILLDLFLLLVYLNYWSDCSLFVDVAALKVWEKHVVTLTLAWLLVDVAFNLSAHSTEILHFKIAWLILTFLLINLHCSLSMWLKAIIRHHWCQGGGWFLGHGSLVL